MQTPFVVQCLQGFLLLAWAPPLASAFGRLSNLFGRDAAARALEEKEDGCADLADRGAAQCKLWADAGECQANYGWMKARCVKTCNLCKPKPYLDHATLAACNDSEHACGNWAREEECEKNPEFMLKTCRAACRKCQSVACNDIHPECVRWAEAGECEHNVRYPA